VVTVMKDGMKGNGGKGGGMDIPKDAMAGRCNPPKGASHPESHPKDAMASHGKGGHGPKK
jgi:hypothetical protein